MIGQDLPVRALANQAAQTAAALDRLGELWRAVAYEGDLSFAQAAHWFAVTLEFEPDLIIELGRHQGNSTAVFTEAAHVIGQTRVKSFCLTDGWVRQEAVAAVAGGNGWLAPLDVYTTDITLTDFAPHVGEASRILVLWDAHGYEVADAMLGGLMPLIAERQHVVICHDISDNRVAHVDRSYEGKPFWRGLGDFESSAAVEPRARLNLGWINTCVDQAIPLLDFCWRNQIELHSADFEFERFRLDSPAAVEALRQGPLGRLVDEHMHWTYFSLNEASPPLHFPARACPRPIRSLDAASDGSVRLSEIETELQLMRASRSWRLTAPMRAFARMLRG